MIRGSVRSCPHSVAVPAAPMTVAAFVSGLSASTAGKGSHRFRPLRDSHIARLYCGLLDRLLAGDQPGACELLVHLREHGACYRVMRVVDIPYGSTILGLLEDSLPGQADYRGWGGLLIRPEARCNRVYQAPHVKADSYTSELTIRAFLGDPRGQVALFAGAHRHANLGSDPDADVTRATDNLFHVLTEHLAGQSALGGKPLWFIQFHGSQQRSREPQITGSIGTRSPDPAHLAALQQLSETVNAAGYLRMGICGIPSGGDDGDYHLCGTENEQGKLLERLGVRDHFLHLELDRAARVAFHRGHGRAYHGVLSLLAALREQLP